MPDAPAILPTPSQPFSPEQKEYLAGFMAGVSASGVLPFVGHTATGQLTSCPDLVEGRNLAAPALSGVEGPAEENFFNTPLSDLCKEERWKHDENPLDAWDRLLKHADENKPPDPEHTYRFKFRQTARNPSGSSGLIASWKGFFRSRWVS